jgi:hypothetical protein
MPQADKVSWRFRRLLDNFFSSRPQKQHRQHVEQQGEGAQADEVENGFHNNSVLIVLRLSHFGA